MKFYRFKKNETWQYYMIKKGKSNIFRSFNSIAQLNFLGVTMTNLIPWLSVSENRRPRAAIFLSGSGSNAEKLLTAYRENPNPAMEIVCLVTDLPETSRARELGERFALPVVENDIRKFYADHGVTKVSLMTEEGRRLREEWTDILRDLLKPYDIDFGIFAGFIPLCNITSDFPCLNVHPGDLTYIKNNERYLVGLHTIPIERAILEGLTTLRTSVIIAEPYTGKGDDMDKGAIIGLSDEVAIDFCGHSLEELKACFAARPTKRPKGGYADVLEQVASHNQERLKEGGDWLVFPPSAEAFACGRYYRDDVYNLYYKTDDDKFVQIKTVYFDSVGQCHLIEV